MSIVYHIDKKKGYTLVQWEGGVTADEFLTHVRRLCSDADWPPSGRLHLSYLNAVSLDASLDEARLKAAADLYGQHPDKIAGMKVAIVANSAFWKAVEFERIISQYGAVAIVFNDLRTACIWLNLNASEIKSLLLQMRVQPRGQPN